ncbi:TIGR02757 family protein [bacterium]|nr:TIGR02757 family protein [bacterium]
MKSKAPQSLDTSEEEDLPEVIERSLREKLDGLYLSYDASFLHLDPLEIVRRYRDPADAEIAAFISAALSIGRVDLFRPAIEKALGSLRPGLSAFVRSFDPARDLRIFNGFVYRFFRGPDLAVLLWRMKQILIGYGSIQSFFLEAHDPAARHIGPALSSFIRRIRSIPAHPVLKGYPGSGIRAFLADPEDGSACKRLNLFLRWMVRKDHLDLGLWTGVRPDQLVMPVDTHIARIGRMLGLTGIQSPGWAMALEITDSLRRFDPADPVKYDFALCTIGKTNACPSEPGAPACRLCPLDGYCIRNRNAPR